MLRTLPVLAAQESRALEEKAFQRLGIKPLTLMERAGSEAAAAAVEMLGSARGKKVLLLLGKGNNAGDALAAGRLLSKAGADVSGWALFPLKDFSADAKKTKAKFPRLRPKAPGEGPALGEYDLIVDGVLGTGSRPGFSDSLARVVDEVNHSGTPVLAVDLPSGLDAVRGLVPGTPVIQAALTLALLSPKLGFLAPGAYSACGRIRCASLGLPLDLLEAAGSSPRWMLEPPPLVPRPREFHKGKAGRVAVVGGSAMLAGAAVLAAKAAFRSGAGLVYLYHPRATTAWTASRLLGEIAVPVGGSQTETFGSENAGEVLAALGKMDAVVLGPGLGGGTETAAFVRKLRDGMGGAPLVLDADGLGAYAGKLAALQGREGPTLLSPHPGEMGRLLGTSSSEVQADRAGALKAAVAGTGCWILLKGALTLIAGPGTPIYVNPTGDTGLSKGGSGDILSGLLAGFLAQGMGPLNAALAGAFYHGRAGEVASGRGDPRATVPEDVLASLGEAFKTP